MNFESKYTNMNIFYINFNKHNLLAFSITCNSFRMCVKNIFYYNNEKFNFYKCV